MMNALSFTLAPTQAPGASSSPATGNDGGKPGGDAFKQLLDDTQAPAKPGGKEVTDKPRPASKSTSGTGEAAPATEEPGGKPVGEATQGNTAGDTGNASGDDDNADAPWPPPGLSMIAPAVATPAPATTTETPPVAVALPLQPPVTPVETAPVITPETAAPATATPMPATTATAATPPSGALPGTLANPSATPATAPASEEAAVPAEVLPPLPDDMASIDNDTQTTAPPSFGHLLQGMSAQAARSEPAPPFTGELAAPVATHAADFDEAIGARVGWLAEQKIGHAHIRVTPNDLGPVEVRLQLDGDRIHASFTSAHADVRQALENSLPKLREMLGEQGLQLAHADVGQHSDPRASDGSAHAGGTGDARDGGEPPPAMPAPTAHTLRLRGLLDAYA